MYFEFMKKAVKNSVAYRFNIWARMLGDLAFIIMWISVWAALYQGHSDMNGITMQNALLYVMITQLLISCNHAAYPIGRMEGLVREGRISSEILKPYDFITRCIAEDSGQIFSYFILSGFPVFMITFQFMNIGLPIGPLKVLLFIYSALCGCMIKYFIELSFGLLSLWFIQTRIQPIFSFTISLFSGAAVPLWFFPDWLENIANVLPFKGIYFVPSAIFTGQLQGSQLQHELLVQGMWVVASFLLLRWMWATASKRVVVQGG
ncbi:ABC transporter permease [Paenibacillus wynnii]|uniref:ABC transporter permease n=1 Tax=Paenibacillus wynnii TaxID=268407 RepID=UPI00278E3CD4|nr:ABC-2 family transporter protein [Paenibacillus wynnii]MDQ0193761.1 ABC-2 type transport system permease protein [Paenibacillus wynnii]